MVLVVVLLFLLVSFDCYFVGMVASVAGVDVFSSRSFVPRNSGKGIFSWVPAELTLAM